MTVDADVAANVAAEPSELDRVWESNGKPLFRDRAGRPITLRTWSELRLETSYRTVERTTVGAHEVITAWLGTDQGCSLDDTPPLIFGTIARNVKEETFDDRSERFAATESDARHNHHRLVVTMTASL